MVDSTAERIVTLPAMVRAAAGIRRSGRTLFTNGCFDLLHVGHVQCLERARSHADVLVVAVNSDASVGWCSSDIESRRHRREPLAWTRGCLGGSLRLPQPP